MPYIPLFLTLLGAVSAYTAPKVLSSFDISNPGFITLTKNATIADKVTWDIITSQFNGFPFSTDYVSVVRDIGSPDGGYGSRVETITSQLHWPNEPGAVPGKKPAIVIVVFHFLHFVLYCFLVLCQSWGIIVRNCIVYYIVLQQLCLCLHLHLYSALI